jgi:hypothetical protein
MLVTIDPQKELVDCAMSMLFYEADNPDVGMGMNSEMVIQFAETKLVKKFGPEFSKLIDKEAAMKQVREKAQEAHLPGWCR